MLYYISVYNCMYRPRPNRMHIEVGRQDILIWIQVSLRGMGDEGQKKIEKYIICRFTHKQQ